MEEFPRGKLINHNRIYSGRIVDLVVDTIEIGGTEHIREVVRHPGGVVFLGETADGSIPFVRQLRYPLDRVLLELPAGKIDPNEDPATSAAREMEEETGLRPLGAEFVLSFYSSPGFCDEKLHLFYANRLEKTAPNLEQDEHLRVEFHSLNEALEMARKGEIEDAKTLVALLWLKAKRAGE